MKQLYMKQKVFSLSGRFTVKDQQENDVYVVEGGFMKVPKTFTILNTERDIIAVITKKMFSFLPKFLVEVGGQEVLTIKKEFTFFKAKYSIDLCWNRSTRELVGYEFPSAAKRRSDRPGKEGMVYLGDSYKVDILKEEMEPVMIALVVAIDCVKADEAASRSSSTTTN